MPACYMVTVEYRLAIILLIANGIANGLERLKGFSLIIFRYEYKLIFLSRFMLVPI